MTITLDAYRETDCDDLINAVDPKVATVFGGHSANERRAIYRYLFSRRPRKLPPSMKSRLINLYDPMADRRSKFPDGLRWCLNTYVGCVHGCGYCYVNGYSRTSVGTESHPKTGFEHKLQRDLNDLRRQGVPKAPLHLSNSTDPLQKELEEKHRHTLLALDQVAAHRDLFSSVVLLTKNPELLLETPYLDLVSSPGMQPLVVQVSCAYWRDEPRQFFEPGAPRVQDRRAAVSLLAEAGVRIELRIDPLLPSARIDATTRHHHPLPHYGIPEAQTADDLLQLVAWAKENGVEAIIGKPLKVAVSRQAARCKAWFAQLYADAANGKRAIRGGSWRLPPQYQQALLDSIRAICDQAGIPFKHCLRDVLTRRS